MMEAASETESAATRGSREKLTSVSSHIVDKAWKIAAERFLRKELCGRSTIHDGEDGGQ